MRSTLYGFHRQLQRLLDRALRRPRVPSQDQPSVASCHLARRAAASRAIRETRAEVAGMRELKSEMDARRCLSDEPHRSSHAPD